MKSLAIIKPAKVTAIGGNVANAQRLLTPNPKEGASIAESSIILDCGQPTAIDTLFVGYHTATGAQATALYASDAAGNVTGTVVIGGLAPLGIGTPASTFLRGAAPITSRYFTIGFGGNGSPAFVAGVIMIGLSWATEWGHEWGAGRFIEDTGTAERLFGGGFGIDEGVAAGGYQWTFGDLQPAETEFLYQLVKERRTTRSVLVVEDPDQTEGLNSRIHWGLFSKLEPYERLDPLNTKWSLQVKDWA